MSKNDCDNEKLESGLKRTMEEVIFRCIRCNHTVFKISKDSFVCPECDFKWEII